MRQVIGWNAFWPKVDQLCLPRNAGGLELRDVSASCLSRQLALVEQIIRSEEMGSFVKACQKRIVAPQVPYRAWIAALAKPARYSWLEKTWPLWSYGLRSQNLLLCSVPQGQDMWSQPLWHNPNIIHRGKPFYNRKAIAGGVILIGDILSCNYTFRYDNMHLIPPNLQAAIRLSVRQFTSGFDALAQNCLDTMVMPEYTSASTWYWRIIGWKLGCLDPQPVFVKLWWSPLSTVIKFWIWRAILGKLAVKERVSKRIAAVVDACPFCT
jgi:hypothetical protein